MTTTNGRQVTLIQMKVRHWPPTITKVRTAFDKTEPEAATIVADSLDNVPAIITGILDRLKTAAVAGELPEGCQGTGEFEIRLCEVEEVVQECECERLECEEGPDQFYCQPATLEAVKVTSPENGPEVIMEVRAARMREAGIDGDAKREAPVRADSDYE